jgi:protein tyrosine phosphatase
MDLSKKVFDERGFIEKFGGMIPGFGGYFNRNKRRDADKLLREYIARQMDEQRGRLANVTVQLTSAPDGLKHLELAERATMKMQVFIDKMKTASYGYAGWFDAVKVDEKDLEAIYNYDNSLLEGVGRVANEVTALEGALDSGEGIPIILRNLVKETDDLNRAFTKRQDVILGTS